MIVRDVILQVPSNACRRRPSSSSRRKRRVGGFGIYAYPQYRLTPGLGAREFEVSAHDRFGNAISNVEVALTLADEIAPPVCSAHGIAEAPPSGLFEAGSCPVDLIELAGHACVNASLTVLTRAGRTLLGIASTPVLGATVALRAEIVTGEAGTGLGSDVETVVWHNAGEISGGTGQVCSATEWFGVVQWYTPYDGDQAATPSALSLSSSFGPVPYSMEAALPATRFPVSRRVTQVRATTRGTLVWSAPEAPGVVAVNLQGGSAENLRSSGSVFEYDLQAGTAPGAVEGGLVIRAHGGELRQVPVPTAHVDHVLGRCSTQAERAFLGADGFAG